MNSEQIKYGLEKYSHLSLDPQQAMTIHVDERGYQTPLPWHVLRNTPRLMMRAD